MKQVPMIDQYDRPIPDDLVVLDLNPEDYPEYLPGIDALDWYEPDNDHPAYEGVILVSYAALSKAFAPLIPPCETDPADVLGEPLHAVNLIAHLLHRWSEEDGFYHA